MSDNRPKSETRNVPALSLRAAFQPSTINDEARTVEVQWTTGAKVLRSSWFDGDFYEELSLDPKSVRMDRLSSGRAPFLANHDSRSLDSVIGVVEAANIGSARVRFVKGDPAADAAWNKVKQGVLPNVSVGYRVHKMEKVAGGEGETPTFRVTDWTPHEISLVPMGADAAAYVRSDTDKNQCVFVTQESRTMADEKTTPEQNPAPAAQTPDLDAVRAEAVKADRQRQAEINKAVRVLGSAGPDLASKLIADGTSVADARALILDQLAAREEKNPIQSHLPVEVGATQREKSQRGALAALAQRAGLTKEFETLKGRKVKAFADFESDPGEFGGMRLIRIAQEILERSGVSTRGMDDRTLMGAALTHTRAGAGYSPTSDFATVLENLMYKSLLGAYNTAPDTWRRFCKTDTVQDFRAANRYRLGSFGVLDTITENEEFKNKSIPDGAKTQISVATKGDMIAISRQALINDDLGALTAMMGMFGRAAGLSIETDVYALLTAHSGLGAYFTGSTPFFDDTAYKNVNTTASALGVQGIDADRVVLASQLDPSGNEYLNLRPQVLLVPIGLGASARTINFAEYDVTQSNKFMVPNIVRGLFADVVDTPRLTGTRRYLFADPNEAPAIVVAFLAGSGEAPFMESRLGWRVDGTEMKLRIDYKAQLFDPKGAVTNAGA